MIKWRKRLGHGVKKYTFHIPKLWSTTSKTWGVLTFGFKKEIMMLAGQKKRRKYLFHVVVNLSIILFDMSHRPPKGVNTETGNFTSLHCHAQASSLSRKKTENWGSLENLCTMRGKGTESKGRGIQSTYKCTQWNIPFVESVVFGASSRWMEI
jgi:hypothetical protein